MDHVPGESGELVSSPVWLSQDGTWMGAGQPPVGSTSHHVTGVSSWLPATPPPGGTRESRWWLREDSTGPWDFSYVGSFLQKSDFTAVLV